MLVGQFGSFVSLFLDAWKGTIEEGDIFITNDVYEIKGAVSHLNDIIVLLPIFWNHELIGWSSQFGHLTDVGGKVAGSLAITANSVYDDGVQIPLTKLYAKGKMNDDLVNLLCRNSRQPDWYRADLTAIVATCKIAGGRICELADRYGLNVYKASCDELLNRNKVAMGKIIDSLLTDESNTFTDFVDDDGSGVGPWGVTCTLSKTPERKMRWDWTGTSPQSEHGINYYFSEVMFVSLDPVLNDDLPEPPSPFQSLTALLLERQCIWHFAGHITTVHGRSPQTNTLFCWLVQATFANSFCL